MISKTLISLAAATLVGCSTVAVPNARNVMIIPDDCANSKAIGQWLEEQSQRPKLIIESREHHNESVQAVKVRLWSLRYRCQS